MKVIAIASEKGGTGKSTTAQAIGYGLHARGMKTLLIDLDPQSSLSMLCGIDVLNMDVSLMDALTGEKSLRNCIRQVKTDLDIVPAGMSLSLVDTVLYDQSDKETRLKTAMETVKDDYDICIMDCSPSFSLMTICALTAADFVIVPVQLDMLSLQALLWFGQFVDGIKEATNPHLNVIGVLITAYDSRTTVSRNILPLVEEVAKESLNTKVFTTKIRKSVALQKAQLEFKDIYSKRNAATEDYLSLLDEIAQDM